MALGVLFRFGAKAAGRTAKKPAAFFLRKAPKTNRTGKKFFTRQSRKPATPDARPAPKGALGRRVGTGAALAGAGIGVGGLAAGAGLDYLGNRVWDFAGGGGDTVVDLTEDAQEAALNLAPIIIGGLLLVAVASSRGSKSDA